MRRNIILLLSALLLQISFFTLTAQNQSRRMNIEDYEKRKIEFIGKAAELTQAESDKHFPLNNELMQKKFEVRKRYRDKVQKIKDNSNISDEEYRKLLENDVELKLQEAALEKDYTEKFEKVLTPEKLYKAQQAERDFMQKEVSNFRNAQGNRRQGNNR